MRMPSYIWKSCRKTGLHLFECGFLDSSADGLVISSSREIKCPFQHRNVTIIEMLKLELRTKCSKKDLFLKADGWMKITVIRTKSRGDLCNTNILGRVCCMDFQRYQGNSYLKRWKYPKTDGFLSQCTSSILLREWIVFVKYAIRYHKPRVWQSP